MLNSLIECGAMLLDHGTLGSPRAAAANCSTAGGLKVLSQTLSVASEREIFAQVTQRNPA